MQIISEFVIFGTFLTACILLLVLLACGLVIVGMGVKRESN